MGPHAHRSWSIAGSYSRHSAFSSFARTQSWYEYQFERQPGIPPVARTQRRAHRRAIRSRIQAGARRQSGFERRTESRPLGPGESEDCFELCDGEVLQTLSVVRDEENPQLYHVSAGHRINFTELAPSDVEDKQTWLDDRDTIIADTVAERYGPDVDIWDGDDWDSVEVSLGTTIHSATPLARKAVADAAWNDTGIVRLDNEADPSTYGAESLDRTLREKLDSSVVISDSTHKYLRSREVNDYDLDNFVDAKFQRGDEIDDIEAIAICRRFDSSTYPALHELSRNGTADKDALRQDIVNAYNSDQSSAVSRRCLNMLRT